MTTPNDDGSPARRQRRRSRKRPRPRATTPQPTPLHERLSTHFKRADRQRGAEYFRQDRVRLDVDGARARAKVKGNQKPFYGVGVNWSRVDAKHMVHAYCECQRFASGGPCKHLWAALLALAETAPKNMPEGTDRLALRKDRPGRWRDLPTSEAGGGQSQGRKTRSTKTRKTPTKTRSTKGRKKSWRDHIDGVRLEVAKLSGELPELFPATDQADQDITERDIRFLVNAAASDAIGGLVLDLFEGQENDDGSVSLKKTGIPPSDFAPLLVPLTATESVGAAEASHAADGRESGDEIEAESETDGAEVELEAAGNGERSATATPSRSSAPLAALVTTLPADSPRRRGRGPNKKKLRIRTPKVQRILLPQPLYEIVLPKLARRDALGWWDGHANDDLRPLDWDEGEPWRLGLRLEIAKDGVGKLRGSLVRGGRGAQPDGEVGNGGDGADDDLRSVSLGECLLFAPTPTAAAKAPAVALPPAHGTQNGDADDDEAASVAESLPTGVGEAPPTTLVLFPDSIARFDLDAARDVPWLELLDGNSEVSIPPNEMEEAITALLEVRSLPHLELPEELQLSEERSAAQPRLVLESESAPEWMNPPLRAELTFVYGELELNVSDTRPAVVDWQKRTYLRRDMGREHAALMRLLQLEFRPVSTAQGQGHGLELNPEQLPAVAEPLLREGWDVEVHGTTLRPSAPPSFRVESNIDWFELSGSVDFGVQNIDMARALEAISKGDRFIELEDGSKGLLPEQWVETYDSLSKLSHETADDGSLRFLPSQAMIVDALLAATPARQFDKPFEELRTKLRQVDRIKPKKELKSFQGTLREYQRTGLGWLEFLREFSLGGVLADDMGLGKTVQVLALIHANRTAAKSTGLPFLVVAPRSLVYNWIEEAKSFTPKVKVAEYAGADRDALKDHLNDYDLVVTTYGTLRRDATFLASVEFDTVVLDEAQAIKNRDSQSAKASRLLVARNRLALTGTPIENHLGELGSIFEFLNPGLFGRMPKLDALQRGGAPTKREIKLVAEGIRPFILRRTKNQVLTDLPPKTELTMHCTLQEEQRKLYDQLRVHYQTSLMEQVGAKGVGGSAFQVLEALLRLRQVACHPGLVDPEWEAAGSSKLEALFSHVSEVLEEGHKVIVFSQFVKLLTYVKKELEQKGIEYAYLDGQTRDRGAVVDRFQTDPSCNLFLISLKAGGTGLNLTAAGYVFLLDPWWNPAVEAQAIDRAHRIGQTQPVFAYRLIARDTVEEKILELQRSKRELADAILEGEGTPLSELTAEDLQMLLS